MITIKPFDGSYKKGYITEGHADYAEHGRDIVCASVSAITQTILLGLKEVVQLRYVQKSGYLEIELYRETQHANILITTMLKGLREIAKQYPNYIQIKEEDTDEL